MKSKKRVLAMMSAGLLATTTLFGCSSSSSSSTTTTAAATTAAAVTVGGSEDTNAEEVSEGAALQEDIIIGMQSKHTTIDQMEASNTQHNYMWRMMLDSLTHYNNETGEVEPSLATEWSTEDNGKSYTFSLRDDVTFHNGEAFKASDVVFTFYRMEGTTSCNSVFAMIESVEATDDYTVVITLNDANVDWPYMMTLPTAAILSEKACADDPVDGPAVGTGPWMLDSYEFGNFTKLVAYEENWRGAPNAKSFTFKYVPDDSARLIALQNGEIDICQDPSNIELGVVEDDPNLDLISYQGGSLTYFAFNTQAEPANDENLRKAVAYGIDVDSLIAVAAEGYGTKGTSFWGWNEYGYYDCGGYERDIEKAKEYLAKSYPNGGATLEISISGSTRKTIAEMIQSQLKEVGIEVSINELDSAGISTSTTNGEHQSCIYGMGFNVFGDDVRRILQPGSAVNKAHYDSDEVMNLLDEAIGEMDDASRKAMYQEIQEIIYEEVPYIPIYFADGFIAAKKGTGGIDIYPTSHHDYSNVFIPVE